MSIGRRSQSAGWAPVSTRSVRLGSRFSHDHILTTTERMPLVEWIGCALEQLFVSLKLESDIVKVT